jgi:hypothetical protein
MILSNVDFPDFRPRVECQMDIVENLFRFIGQNLGQSGQGKHELSGSRIESSLLYRLFFLWRLRIIPILALTFAFGLFPVQYKIVGNFQR